MDIDAKKLQRLVAWTISPQPPHAIQEILLDLDDDDLVVIMKKFNGPAAHIAWAEYGRRREFAEFEVRAVQLDDNRTALKFMASAKPIHTTPILDVKR